MAKSKIWQRADGSIFRNDGPRNPVDDIDAAHAMALASNRVLEERELGLELVDRVGFDSIPYTHMALGRLASMSAEELSLEMDKAAERVRSNIGGYDIERAKILFDLVELSPSTQQD